MVERKDLERNKNTIDAANNEKGLKDNYSQKVDPSRISSVSTMKTSQANKEKKMKSRGLGDTIEKFTKATGIKKLADSIPGGCGCDHRKEWFNKNFPYNMNKK